MKTIIGIDPGLAATGYGIIKAEGGKHTHVKHGVLVTDPAETRGHRLRSIYSDLEKILREFKPEEAGVESLFFAKNVKTALPVAEAIGVILMCLATWNITFKEYTPLEVKQAVIGKGRGEKHQVQHMIKLIFGLPELPRPDHASDALAVALCHLNQCTLRGLIDRGT